MNLITGGTGFLGAHMAAYLLKQKQEVTIFKRPGSSLSEFRYIFNFHFGAEAESFLQHVEFCEGDILNPADLANAFREVKHVYHCAAMVSFDKNMKSRMFEVNISGTRNIVDTLLDFPEVKLCHVSSIAALGRNPENEFISESVLWNEHGNHSEYSRSKYLSELEVWRGIAEGLNAVIVNPGVILGLGNPEKGSCKLFRLVEKGLRFYTEGVNGYVDVNDVAAVMFRLMQKDISGRRFIVVAENLSYRQLFDSMARSFGKRAPDIHVSLPARKLIVSADWLLSVFTGRKRNYSPDFAVMAGMRSFYDSSALKVMLEYEFTPADEYIGRSCSYFKENPYE